MSDFRAELPPELDVAPVKRSPSQRIAIAIGAAVVVLAATFAAVSLAGGDENGPTDPVRAMLVAAEHNDVLGILEQLDPGERDAVRGPLQELAGELNRLGVLDHASLSNLTGYELKVSDLALDATEVRDGLQTVKVSAGKTAYTIDPSKLPLGRFVRDLAGDGLNEKSSGTGDLKQGEGDPPIAVVKRGNRWYVSVGYSAAESARRDAKKSIADLGSGVPAVGADSPEQAVRDLITAATKLDVRRLVELLPPDELGAVHDYANLFIAAAENGAAGARDSFSITMPTLDLAADTTGDQSMVTITALELSGSSGGTTFSFKDGCLDVSGDSPQHLCPGQNIVQGLQALPLSLFGDVQPPQFSFAGKHAKVGIVATRVDGKWYVSPTRTLLTDVVAAMKLVEPSDLDKARDWFKQIQASIRDFGQSSSSCVQVTPAGQGPCSPGTFSGTSPSATATTGPGN